MSPFKHPYPIGTIVKHYNPIFCKGEPLIDYLIYMGGFFRSVYAHPDILVFDFNRNIKRRFGHIAEVVEDFPDGLILKTLNHLESLIKEHPFFKEDFSLILDKFLELEKFYKALKASKKAGLILKDYNLKK